MREAATTTTSRGVERVGKGGDARRVDNDAAWGEMRWMWLPPDVSAACSRLGYCAWERGPTESMGLGGLGLRRQTAGSRGEGRNDDVDFAAV